MFDGWAAALAGVVAGAGGGLCQVSIMGPCTYLVTGAVTGDRSVTTMQRVRRTWATNGFKVRTFVSTQVCPDAHPSV